MKRRMILIPTLALLMLLAIAPAMSVVHATRPTAASGIWEYIPSITGMRSADGNTFIEVASADVFTGTFEGTSHGVYSLVIHSSGFWYAKGLVTFDSCTVNGKSGTLVIRFVGKGTAEGQWSGQWVILSGTDGLANLRGQGTWWGPEVPGGNTYPYSGLIHFEPD